MIPLPGPATTLQDDVLLVIDRRACKVCENEWSGLVYNKEISGPGHNEQDDQ